MEIQSNNSGQNSHSLRSDITRPVRKGVESNVPSREEIAEKVERTQQRAQNARQASRANKAQDRAQAARHRFHQRSPQAENPTANEGRIADAQTQQRAQNARQVATQNATQQRLQAVRDRLPGPHAFQLNGQKGDQVQLSPQAQLLAAAAQAGEGADANASAELLQELRDQLEQGSLSTQERISRAASRLLGGE